MNSQRWESHIDKLIRQAMDEGEFRQLPGESQPLDLQDDPYTPADMQLAYKIMRDNNYAPDWVVQGKELAKKRERILGRLGRAYQQYRQSSGDETHRALQAAADWSTAQQQLSVAFGAFNREVLDYNLKVPVNTLHLAVLNWSRELERLKSVTTP